MSTSITCPDCGHTTTSRTRAQAEYGQRRHSCDTVRERAARAQRRLDRLAASGPEAPCTHDDRHPHGDRVRYVVDRCRCRACRDATRAYNAERRRQNLYGSPAYVDAGPARAHVNALGMWGMGWKRVARAAGIHASVVWKLLYGCPSRAMEPSKRIRARTASAILAVELDIADGALLDATGTRRRLQALATQGWSVQALAEHIGCDRQRLDRAIRGEQFVRKATADAVTAVYDQLWNTPAESPRAEATRRRAARLGWAPPLAWDDEDIDTPTATPEGVAS